MRKEINDKIRQCKALQGMSVKDLINSERFIENLSAYLRAQQEDRKAIRKSYGTMVHLGGNKDFKLPAHPIDHFVNMTAREFADEYLLVVAKCSKRPASQRQYISQLGGQAYALTVSQYVVDEFPELSDELLPKSNKN